MTQLALTLAAAPMRALVRQVQERVSLLVMVTAMTVLTTPLSAPSRVSH